MAEISTPPAPRRIHPPVSFWGFIGLLNLSALLLVIDTYFSGGQLSCFVRFSFLLMDLCLLYTWQILIGLWLGFLGSLAVFGLLARIFPRRTQRATILLKALSSLLGLGIALGSLFESVPVLGYLNRQAGQAYLRLVDAWAERQARQAQARCLQLVQELGDDVRLWDFQAATVIDSVSNKIEAFDLSFRLTSSKLATVSVNATLSFPAHSGDFSAPDAASAEITPGLETRITLRVTRRYYSPIWPVDKPVPLRAQIELRWLTPAPSGLPRRTTVSYREIESPPEAYCGDEILYALYNWELITPRYYYSDFLGDREHVPPVPTPLIQYEVMP